MRWTNVKLICLREVRDQLRDRRTLFMILLLPVLLYPAMGIGLVQGTIFFTAQQRHVVLLGAEDLPEADQGFPPLLSEGRLRASPEGARHAQRDDHYSAVRFAPELFEESADAGTLHVVIDSRQRQQQWRRALTEGDIDVLVVVPPGYGEQLTRWAAVVQPRTLGNVLRRVSGVVYGGRPHVVPGRDTARRVVAGAGANRPRHVGDSEVSPGGQDPLDRVILPHSPLPYMRELAGVVAGGIAAAHGQAGAGAPHIEVLYVGSRDSSRLAYERVQDVFESWNERLLADQLSRLRLPRRLLEPVQVVERDLARPEQMRGTIWSRVLPFLLVVMALTGAFYPAIDLCAGEKERGTMETLLISPAARGEIVMGKYLTIMGFSMLTAVLNLASMGLTGWHLSNLADLSAKASTAFGPPNLAALLWMLALLVPLAALFSALCLALAAFARSTKEGQYYLMPLMVVTLPLTLLTLLPTVEIQPFYSVVPVLGVALLLKALLAADYGAAQLYFAPVLITTLLYSLLALRWAVDQFSRESVLFREAERIDLRLWLRHLLRDKEARPSFGEAVFCFATLMLLQFVLFNVLAVPPDADATTKLRVVAISQVAMIAAPVLLMAIMLTRDPAGTLRLRLPRPAMLLAALVLAVGLHPLAIEFQVVLRWFFPPLPEQVTRGLEFLSDPSVPLGPLVLIGALVPAVCEELAFRGFILSGLAHGGRIVLALVASSLFFGILHIIPAQAFNASLLGLVIGLLALASASLFVCILFHFSYNALAILHGRLTPEALGEHGSLAGLLRASGDELHYQPWVLVAAGVIVALAVAWLIAALGRRGESRSRSSSAE